MNIRLKELRIALGKPQAKIAEVLGLKQSSISRLEAIGRDLSDIQIGKLCEEFGRENVMKFVGTPAPPEVDLPKREYSLEEAFAMIAETNKTLSRTVEAQQNTIEEMRNKIDELNEALAYYRQTDKQ